MKVITNIDKVLKAVVYVDTHEDAKVCKSFKSVKELNKFVETVNDENAEERLKNE